MLQLRKPRDRLVYLHPLSRMSLADKRSGFLNQTKKKSLLDVAISEKQTQTNNQNYTNFVDNNDWL